MSTAITEINKSEFDEAVTALVELVFNRRHVSDDPHKSYVVAQFKREFWDAAREACEVLRPLGFGPAIRQERKIPDPAPPPSVIIDGVEYAPVSKS